MSKRAYFTPSQVFSPWLSRLEEAPQVMVGFSGGVDSTVLLHILCAVIPAEKILAVHVHHGLSGSADMWQKQAGVFCASLGVQMRSESVSISPSGEGLEAAAREERYKVFQKRLEKDGLLLLAHHADDQVETVLYHLLRGSGPKGLAGIPAERPIGQGQLIRPLLPYPKQALKAYAEENGLNWVEDESNRQDEFDRNYLRNQVIPSISERWPDYAARIRHSSNLCRETDGLVISIARDDLALLDVQSERAGWSLSMQRFFSLTQSRQKNFLRHWPGFYGLPLPGHKIVAEIIDSLLHAREDAEPKVSWKNVQINRYRDRLFLLLRSDRPESVEDACLYWQVDEPLVLPDGNCLDAERVNGGGLRVDDGAAFTVCFRKGGERCKPAGRQHSNSLKKLLQEYGLEPWWRNRVPLIFIGEELVAVGDLWVCEGWQATDGETGLNIRWQTSLL